MEEAGTVKKEKITIKNPNNEKIHHNPQKHYCNILISGRNDTGGCRCVDDDTLIKKYFKSVFLTRKNRQPRSHKLRGIGGKRKSDFMNTTVPNTAGQTKLTPEQIRQIAIRIYKPRL